MKCAVAILSAVLLISACSTVKVIPEGKYRLADNIVSVSNDKDFNTSSLSPYIKQEPTRFFLGLWIYNWSNGKNDGWDKFVKKMGQEPTVLEAGLIRESEKSIVDHLKYVGYYGSSATHSCDTTGRKVKVHYDVTLGDRYTIDDISYKLPEGEIEDEFYADTMHSAVKVGMYLSEELLEAESGRSAVALKNLGYYDINKFHYSFQADTVSVSGSAKLVYALKDYTRSSDPSTAKPLLKYHFGDVNISYPAELKFRDKVLTDLNTIRPGMLYSVDEVDKTYNRLTSLRLFSNINVGLSPSDSLPGTVDCNINLTPGQLKGFKLFLEASSSSNGLIGLTPQITFYHKNLFHGGEWLDIGVNGDFQFKTNDSDSRSQELGANVKLSLPKMLGVSNSKLLYRNIPRTEIGLKFSYQNRPEFRRTMFSLNYGYSVTIGKKLFLQLYPLQANVVKLFNVSDSFKETLDKNPHLRYSYENHFDAGVGGNIYWTSNSDVIPTVDYRYLRFRFDLSGNLLSLFKGAMAADDSGHRLVCGLPYAQYVAGELHLGKTWFFGPEDRQSLALRLLGGAGYAYGNSVSLPYEKQFFVGGANSMRGWQAHTLGPGADTLNTSFVIPSQSGDLRLEANAEYRYKLFWKIEGATFLDVGNVWNMKYMDNFPETIAASWGLGIRLNFNVLLLRLDFGMKVREPSRPAGERWLGPPVWFRSGGNAWHFAIGYPF